MRIESYDFGKIQIEGEVYRSDVIVLPGSVKSGWWRKEGHRLDLLDLDEVLEVDPEVLIVGTGYHGRMVVPDHLVRELEKRGIELLSFDTGAAVESFNELSLTKRAVAALHLTC